jgi:hypothetical protein
MIDGDLGRSTAFELSNSAGQRRSMQATAGCQQDRAAAASPFNSGAIAVLGYHQYVCSIGRQRNGRYQII